LRNQQNQRSFSRFGINYLLLALALLPAIHWLLQPFALSAATLSQQPSVGIQLNGLRYDEAANLYTLSISISQPGFVKQLLLIVEEKEAGKLVSETLFTVDGRSTIIAELDGRMLVDERAYLIKIRGTDYADLMILQQDEHNTGDQSEQSILATKEFTHILPKAKPIEATILNVNVDFDTQLMLIDVDIRDEDAIQISKFEGWVIDKESGARIHEFGPRVFANKRIQEALPLAIVAATAPREYELYLVLTTKEDQPIRPEARGFKPTPPPPPSFFNRLSSGLNSNSVLLTTMLIIVIALVGWLAIQNGQGRREPLLPPRPPISGTTITENYGGSRQLGVRLSVVYTEHVEDRISKVIYQFPCDIGREGCQFNIPHDAHISRHHAQLTVRNGHFYLSDLESTNGSFIDNTPIPPKQQVPVNELSLIRLGTKTIIKVEKAD